LEPSCPESASDSLCFTKRSGEPRVHEQVCRDLFSWLVDRALEHDDRALLVRLAAVRLKAEGSVRSGSLPAGRVARVVRDGSYDGLAAAWTVLGSWLDSQGSPGAILGGLPHRSAPGRRPGRPYRHTEANPLGPPKQDPPLHDPQLT
jgi:hypothetical protein